MHSVRKVQNRQGSSKEKRHFVSHMDYRGKLEKALDWSTTDSKTKQSFQEGLRLFEVFSTLHISYQTSLPVLNLSVPFSFHYASFMEFVTVFYHKVSSS